MRKEKGKVDEREREMGNVVVLRLSISRASLAKSNQFYANAVNFLDLQFGLQLENSKSRLKRRTTVCNVSSFQATQAQKKMYYT